MGLIFTVVALMLVIQFIYFTGREESTTRTNQLLDQILFQLKKDDSYQKPESDSGCTFYFGNAEEG